MKQQHPILIEYFSDVLCVWAWIAQPRLRELQKQWGERVAVRHRFIDVFGDCHRKIPEQWGGDSGFESFSSHVCEVARDYEHTPVHENVWRTCRPRSSLQAHLFIKASELSEGVEAADRYAAAIRESFFRELLDVGEREVLLSIALDQGLDASAMLRKLDSGEAIAALSADMRAAQTANVKGSPTWVLNEGRQVLFGNVGYRILHANLEELLKHPQQESSWC